MTSRFAWLQQFWVDRHRSTWIDWLTGLQSARRSDLTRPPINRRDRSIWSINFGIYLGPMTAKVNHAAAQLRCLTIRCIAFRLIQLSPCSLCWFMMCNEWQRISGMNDISLWRPSSQLTVALNRQLWAHPPAVDRQPSLARSLARHTRVREWYSIAVRAL